MKFKINFLSRFSNIYGLLTVSSKLSKFEVTFLSQLALMLFITKIIFLIL